MVTQLLIFCILLAFSALFSSSETALVSLSDVKVRNLVERRVQGSLALARLKRQPQRMLAAILIGSNLASVAASAIAAVAMASTFGSLGIGIATGTVTLLLLVFGEVLPKNFATVHAERIALLVARPLEVLVAAFSPLIMLLEELTKLVVRIPYGGFLQSKVTEDELRTMATMAEEQGTIEQEERKIIESLFKFNDITAEDVMTPRVDMVALDGNLTLADALEAIEAAGRSRIPVYRKDIDHIVGVLYLRDVLTHLANNQPRTVPLYEIAREAYFVPATQNVDELFREMQRTHRHVAIVVDPKGGTEGLVTLEDLLEELVGEIADEGDVSKEVIMRVDRNTIMAAGATEVRRINRFFNLGIVYKETASLSEFLLAQFGRIPEVGEELTFGNALYSIQDASQTHIHRVKIQKIANPLE